MTPDIAWPRNDYSRVPFWLHHDAAIYELEMERSEEHTSELQSRFDLVCRLLLEKKKPFPPPTCHDEPQRLLAVGDYCRLFLPGALPAGRTRFLHAVARVVVHLCHPRCGLHVAIR